MSHRAKEVLGVLCLAVIAFFLTACIQDTSVFTPFAVVTVKINQPPDQTAAGVRVTVCGTGLLAGDTSAAFTDITGFALIRTQFTGFHYICARHSAYDITFGGTAANIPLGGEPGTLAFTRGRIFIPTVESQVEVDYLYPFTGLDPPQLKPQTLRLIPKTPLRAKFCFNAEDSNVLRNTFKGTTPGIPPGGRVFVTGDWNNFNLEQEEVDPINGAKELFDDGGQIHPGDGDDQAIDGVFTNTLTMTPGDHTYAFLVLGAGIFVRDPYEEKSKLVRIVARTPRGSIGNPGVVDVREFVASSVSVTDITSPTSL
jgi:hypothetical protein